MKTSLSDPLHISVVSGGPGLGRVGITFCPGKYDPDGGEGRYWDRDLTLDLDKVHDWGAVAVVTLLEPHELRLLHVERLGEEILRRKMRWFHLPIVDVSVPDERFEQEWTVAGEELRSMLRRRLDVLVHCRGGLGRAGTIAARLLIELGTQPEEAISLVRAVRSPRAIETLEQEEFVRNLRIAPTRV
jgi:ADP-ribosyl-[dinitrogen reductase] hydrolase